MPVHCFGPAFIVFTTWIFKNPSEDPVNNWINYVKQYLSHTLSDRGKCVFLVVRDLTRRIAKN
ncbi:hypothetical protein EMIT091MI3_90148 [Kosakonia quasisacchari]